jgi:hypothetical protein
VVVVSAMFGADYAWRNVAATTLITATTLFTATSTSGFVVFPLHPKGRKQGN